MKMAKINLTDRFIQSRKAAEKGSRDDYADALVPGMALRVSETGHKSFVLYTRYPLNPTIPSRRALGDYYPPPKDEDPQPDLEIRNGALTLAEARAKARGWLDLIARGIDPKTDEARQKATELQKQNNSFSAIASQFLERHVKGPAYVALELKAEELRSKDAKLTKERALAITLADPVNRPLVDQSRKEGIVKKAEAVRIIEGEFAKRWGVRPITDIMPDEVSAAIRAIVKRGASYQAHNAFGYLRGLFNWAIGTGEYGLTASPVERLQPAKLIGKREARSRILAADELCGVWNAADKMGYPYGPLIRLLILTGQREREVAEMSWSEIDVDKKLWTIPAVRMKSDRAHEVPLAPEALKLLKALPRWKKADFVFTTTDGEKPVNGFSKAKTRLDKAVAVARAKARTGKDDVEPEKEDFLPAWVLHDLRRTMRTHLSALPVEDMVRELVIAHAKTGLHKVYDQHVYQDEKRHCLDLYEKRLKGIVEEGRLA